PFANFSVWNVVSASGNSGVYTSDMKLRATQTHVPDPYIDSHRQRRFKQRCDGVSAERGLEGEVQPFGDGPFQESSSLAPGRAIGFFVSYPRIGKPDLDCRLIRVEVFDPSLHEHCAADATFPGAICSRQDIDAGDRGSISHACAPLEPRLFPSALGMH